MTTQDIARPLHEARGWITFLGVLAIVSGAVSCMTFVGVLWGWLPIWQGLSLLQAGRQADQAWLENDPAKLAQALDRLKTYFIISAVVMVLTVVFSVIGLLGLVGLGAMGLLGGLNALRTL